MNLVLHLAWLAATVLIYVAVKRVYRRYPSPLLTPAIVSPLIIIALLYLAKLPYQEYYRHTHWLSDLLGPVTVAFAIPVYRYRAMIRHDALPLLGGLVAGSLTAILTTLVLACQAGLDRQVIISFLPRSISTPFATEAAEAMGGVASLASLSVVITGLLGMVIGELLVRRLPHYTVVAKGTLFGMGAHAAGTAKAQEIDPNIATVSSLAMILGGIGTLMIMPALGSLLLPLCSS